MIKKITIYIGILCLLIMTSAYSAIPRKIAIIYNSKQTPLDDINDVSSLSFTGFILQHLGFIPITYDEEAQMPDTSNGEYAGIITWFNLPIINHYQRFETWAIKQVKSKTPIVFISNFGVPLDSKLLKILNIHTVKDAETIHSVRVVYKDKSVGYEIFPGVLPTEFQPVTINQGKVLVKIGASPSASGDMGTSSSYEEDAVVVAPWGGYILSPFDLVTLTNSQSRWIVNPFIFFTEALHLPAIPVPDMTTENGRRILMAQIDGDAFISRVTWKEDEYAGETILKDILEKYQIPTTVSVVEKEFALLNANSTLQKRMIETAKQIFALPWVEIATHTYSHPLNWFNLVEGGLNTKQLSYPDLNYKFSFEREIVGSANFINQTLAPANKKVAAILWSGDANVGEKPLQIAYKAGLKNINGMSAINSRKGNSLTNLAPFGMYVGPYYQVFAPISNEFEYTDEWSSPLYAFQNVIHTFELTESPVRYKPLSIYYHFYSAVDQSALRGLRRVYDWVMRQKTIPLFVTEYIDKVLGFNDTVISKINNNCWSISNNHALREFRWADQKQYPDLARSVNVIGYNQVNKDIYIHLGDAAKSTICFSSKASKKPYLIDANAHVISWETSKNEIIRFVLKGYVPLQFSLGNMVGCQLMQNDKVISGNNSNYSLEGAHDGTFEIHCTH